MRLCIITHVYPHPGEPWISEPAQWLRELGHDVRVVAAHRGRVPDDRRPVDARFTEGWIPARGKLRVLALHPARAAARLPRALALRDRSIVPFREMLTRAVLPEVSRADAVLAHFGDVGVEWLPVAAAARRPFAVYFHGYDATALPRSKPGIYDQLFASGAALLTNGHYLRERLIALGAPASRVRIVRLATPPALLRRPMPPLAAPRVVTVARLVAKKGLDDSISAFGRARQTLGHAWTYEIIGSGPLRDALGTWAGAEGVEDAVSFRGVIGREALIEALAGASMFVLASKTAPSGDTEGTPVALIEAAALGLPVVSTKHAGIPECLPPDAEARGFLVEEGDVSALAAAIARLGADPELRRRWGHDCRAHARRLFSPAAHAGGLVDALRAHARVPVLPHGTPWLDPDMLALDGDGLAESGHGD